MKTKKNFLALFLCFSLLVKGQTIFDKFEKNSAITAVNISPQMLQLLSKIETNDADSKAIIELTKKINTMKIYTTENQSAGQLMKTEIDNYLKINKLSEYLNVKDKGNNVKFYVKQGKSADIASELLIFVEGTQTDAQFTLMSLTGEIDLTNIGALTKSMNVPSANK